MKIVVLGTAAGGGFPQWNCACALCGRGRAGQLPARTQDCIAVSATGRAWYLVNVSPDIRAQILATAALAAGPGPRDTPLRGALLTDAELDHTLGLPSLREGEGFHVFAPEAAGTALRDRLPLREVIAGYHEWCWSSVAAPVELDGVRCTVLPVHDKPPRYAAGLPGSPWAVAYRFDDPVTGKALVYAPCLRTWPAGFDEFTAGADCVLLDGTFWSAAEMSGTTGTGGQRAMGHLPITGPESSLPLVRDRPGIRWIYTHLNNTNPVLDPRSAAAAQVAAAGAEIARDNTEIDL